MKKVVHINTFCSGGAAKACARINHAMYDAGMDSRMLVLYKTIPDDLITDLRKELPLIEHLYLKIKNRNYTDLLKFKNRNNDELFSLYRSVWNVNRHSLVKQAEVIHLHWVAGLLDFDSFFRSIPDSKKIIFTLHDHYPFSGGPHYPNPCFDSGKWIQLIDRNRFFLNELYKKHHIQFVGPSRYIIDHLMKSGLGNSGNCSVIKNPVDPTIFKELNREALRKKYGFGTNDKVLLYVNENFKYRRKNFSYFKSIYPILIENGYKILICGDRIKDEQKNKNIVQIGYVKDDHELANIYNVADVLLFTSTDDNLPNTISESLCCGTPVVAFNTGGIGEMIDVINNGSLLPKDAEPQIYIDAVKELFLKSIDRKSISKTAQAIYSPRNAAKAYSEFYSK